MSGSGHLPLLGGRTPWKNSSTEKTWRFTGNDLPTPKTMPPVDVILKLLAEEEAEERSRSGWPRGRLDGEATEALARSSCPRPPRTAGSHQRKGNRHLRGLVGWIPFRKRANLGRCSFSIAIRIGHFEVAAETSHDGAQRRGIHGCPDGNPRCLEMAVPDRRSGQTGRTETRINLLAMRRVQLRIDRELKKAEVLPRHASGSCLSCSGKLSRPCRGQNRSLRHAIRIMVANLPSASGSGQLAAKLLPVRSAHRNLDLTQGGFSRLL